MDSLLVACLSDQDFLGDDFKSQGSHVAYNMADFSTQASQSGYGVDYATQGPQAGFPGSYLNQNLQPGYSHLGTCADFISQDYMAHGSQGLFTQAGVNDPSQDEASQGHFGMGAPGPFQSQGLMNNALYSQSFAHYNTQPQTLQPPLEQNQSSPFGSPYAPIYSPGGVYSHPFVPIKAQVMEVVNLGGMEMEESGVRITDRHQMIVR